MTRNIFRDERGFTTTSMVLSMLITLALVFTAAQVYRINSASAEVQDVADAAALSAENQVAEFMIVVRYCDAVVLSLTLSGVAVCGLGIAAMCVPATATLSKGLLDAGKHIIETRDRFSDRAKQVLNKLQKALPYFAAACAAGVSSANNGDSAGSSYLGIALLVPADAEDIEAGGNDKTNEFFEDAEAQADEIRKKAEEAEEAAKEANKAKERAYRSDCGDNPGRCMYERAGSLVGLSGTDNPLYSSVDTWSFSVALNRAKRYFATRSSYSPPRSNSPKDMARAQLQKRYCSYAYDLVSREGYVHESEGSFEASFPSLPSTISEMRDTSLYTDKVYPITEMTEEGESDGDSEPMPVMHAWSGCPGITSEITEYESIYYMETANLATCPYCDFTVQSMGKIASANTSVDRGFEHHYLAVAEEAAKYEDARKRADAPISIVKRKAGKLLEELLDAMKEAVNKRIDAAPPGKYGAVAFVVNTGSTPAAGKFASRFASSAGSLGPRAAISASTLVDEGSDEDRTVINSALDGLREDGSAAVGAAGIALNIWSALLSAYSSGIDALTGGIEKGLEAIPLASVSGLGGWAAEKLRGVIKDVGLEPAKLDALKPVLVNSSHVAAKSDGRAAQGLLVAKQMIIAHPLYSTDLFVAILTDAEREAVDKVDGLGDSIEIASIELLGDGGPSIPITIPLPAEVKQYGVSAIQDIFDRLRAYHAEVSGVRAWE